MIITYIRSGETLAEWIANLPEAANVPEAEDDE